MKRNEMIEKLANYYDEMHLDDYTNSSWLAEITLDFIEEHGMLPPVCTVKVEDGKHSETKRCWDEE